MKIEYLSKVFLPLLLIVSLLLAVTACTPTPASKADEVSVRLKWVHQTQFAGIYMAENEGYYAAENLKVTIEPVDYEQMLSSEKVAEGKNTFGIGSADEVLVARSQGLPVRAIAVIYRINPLIYMSLGDTQLLKPQDLIGKKLLISEGQSTYLLNALLKFTQIDPNQLDIKRSPTFDPMECLKLADVCDAYSTSGLVSAKLLGLRAWAIWPSDYGIPFYADVLFTTEKMIAEQPDVVERFLRATLLGWQAAIQNPTKATEVTLKYITEGDPEFQRGMLEASIPLIDTGDLPIGVMQPEIWQQMYTILVEQGVISTPFDVSTAYTMEFTEKLK